MNDDPRLDVETLKQLDAHTPFLMPGTELEGKSMVVVGEGVFTTLVHLAHALVHPGTDSAEEVLEWVMRHIEGGDTIGRYDDEDDEDTSLRVTALQMAHQMELAKISAERGLEGQRSDVVGHAESYLHFLKGGISG